MILPHRVTHCTLHAFLGAFTIFPVQVLYVLYNVWYVLVSWGSEGTPSATPFFKSSYKISHPPRLYVSWVDLPSIASSSKIWPNFSKKVVKNWFYQKMPITKNVLPNVYSSMKKQLRKIWMIFDIENSLWKSNFGTSLWGGKARQSIP